MFGIAAPQKIWWLRSPSQNAMRAYVHIVAAILFRQDLAISRHQNRH